MSPSPPITLWCQACDVAYASLGEAPAVCPRCDSPDPQWTRTPPYKLTVNDRRFLQSLRIDPD